MRFGLDVGTNSIGWSVLETRDEIPVRLLAASSRIFSDGRDPQNSEPLAVSCRVARGARVRRDRMIGRKKLLLKRLIELGLMPSDEKARQALKNLNPYELRAKAITEAVTAHELGRILMHLAQRRGFKSNRKADNTKDEKATNADMDALKSALESTGLLLGQYFWKERLKEGKEEPQCTRARSGEGLYPRREQYEAEFQAIRSTQAGYHTHLSNENWEELFKILFFQLPLKEQEVGYCQVYFERKDRRAAKALPCFQKFRIAQNIVNLQIISADRSDKRSLNLDERKLLTEALQSQKTLSFNKIRTKLLKLHDGEVFNLESERREKLEGNETAALMSDKKYFGKKWFEFSDDEQNAITHFLLDAGNPEEIFQKAQQEWKITEEQASNLAALPPGKFPKGYARFGMQALRELTQKLTEQGISTTEAIQELRGKRGDNSERRDRLPYYGVVIPESMTPSPKRGDIDTKQYGKINNPTVHIGLNQIRKLINELIEIYGVPDEIYLELARELKLNDEAKKGLATFQLKNQKLRDEAIKLMQESQIIPNDDNIKRYKLWLELSKDVNDRCCPYSGKKISIEVLWSDAVEVEHILPESKTFDSSMKNLTLAFKDANRIKGNRAPDEAFNVPGSPYPYQDIVERVQRSNMSKYKKSLFDPGAMKKFSDDPENGFISRQLTDTQYLSKIASKYLQSLFSGDEYERKKHVHVLPGQLTARIRHQWGLNSILAPDGTPDEEREKKNRNDHRHHAIDAIVIACTDRSMLMKASRASGQDYKGEVTFEPPWEREQFRRDVAEVIGRAIVSHKPDHGVQAKLHEETYYGIIRDEQKSDYERENGYNVVKRGDFRGHFAKTAPDKVEKKIELIRDPVIRKELKAALANVTTADEVMRIVDDYAKNKGIRRIRLLKKEATILPIRHKAASGQMFEKGVVPGSNHHVAFWRLPNGEIEAQGCSFFEINSVSGDMNRLKPHPAAKLICRIHKGDLIAVTENETRRVLSVISLKPSNEQMVCIDNQEGGNISQRVDRKDIKPLYLRFSKMAHYKVRKIYVTPTGIIHDSGSMF